MEAIGFCYFYHFFHYLLSFSFPPSFPHHFSSSLVYKVDFAFLKLLGLFLPCLFHLSLQAEIVQPLGRLSADSKPWLSLLPMKCQTLLFAPIFMCKNSTFHFYVPFSYLFVSCLRIKCMYFYSRYIVLHTKKAINIYWLTVKSDHFYMQ